MLEVLGNRICRQFFAAQIIALIATGWLAPALAQTCPTDEQPIATDRPDVTNSSAVVPQASFQLENGINWTDDRERRYWDGTNTRVRFGLWRCTELLVDLPNYNLVSGPGHTGFSDVVPAVKHQIEGLPGEVQASFVAGLALPTGSARISGRGYSPYVQVPWSRELNDEWAITGMVTIFGFPSQRTGQAANQVTFSIEREIGEGADLFIEYVGDYVEDAQPIHRFNSGGSYHLTPLQQVDFHIGFGFNQHAPEFFVGFGYSFRIDRLL